MALPQIAALTAVALGTYHLFKPPAVKATETGVGACQSKYCDTIHVDKAVNTLMRDDRAVQVESATRQLTASYNLNKRTYSAEATQHPGVQLVAHTVI